MKIKRGQLFGLGRVAMRIDFRIKRACGPVADDDYWVARRVQTMRLVGRLLRVMASFRGW